MPFKVVAGPNNAVRFDIQSKQCAPEEIFATVLRKLVEDAAKYLGEKVTGAVITVIRLGGQGEPGTGQAPAGDLLLHVQLRPHPLFPVLDESDMEIELPVAPWEAALGARHADYLTRSPRAIGVGCTEAPEPALVQR